MAFLFKQLGHELEHNGMVINRQYLLFHHLSTVEDNQKIPVILFHLNWKIEKSVIFNFNRMSSI